MKFPSPVSVSWIANFINAKMLGNENSFASGINEIHKVKSGDIVFVDHPKYYDACLNSAATCIIINTDEKVP
jgi:UDP-3-O-[3-hydroxymyristoyl] glucosamine N-acyltransferase